MDSQLSRILSSNIDTEVISSIEENESQISKLESLLHQKNSQVFHLHQLINTQMHSLVLENEKLKKANNLYKNLTSRLKKQIIEIHNKASLESKLTFNLLKDQIVNLANQLNSQSRAEQRVKIPSIMKELVKNYNDYNSQTQQGSKKISIQVQTELEQKNNQNAQLLERLENLEEKIIVLKEEKWNLEKELSKHQNYQSVAISQHQYSSNNSLSDEEKRNFICHHVSQGFSLLKEKKFYGELVGNVKNGQGFCEYEDLFEYSGSFINGKKHGLGQIKYDGQLVYKGYWKNDVPEGKGALMFLQNSNISKYCGIFKEGKMNGFGTLFYADGRRIISQFIDGEPQGASIHEDDENGPLFGSIAENKFTSKSNAQTYAL